MTHALWMFSIVAILVFISRQARGPALDPRTLPGTYIGKSEAGWDVRVIMTDVNGESCVTYAEVVIDGIKSTMGSEVVDPDAEYPRLTNGAFELSYMRARLVSEKEIVGTAISGLRIGGKPVPDSPFSATKQ